MKHSPGPWRWKRDPHAEGENGNPPLMGSHGHGVGVSWDGASPEDCRLIAAAPDMLALLRRWVGAQDIWMRENRAVMTTETWEREVRELLGRLDR